MRAEEIWKRSQIRNTFINHQSFTIHKCIWPKTTIAIFYYEAKYYLVFFSFQRKILKEKQPILLISSLIFNDKHKYYLFIPQGRAVRCIQRCNKLETLTMALQRRSKWCRYSPAARKCFPFGSAAYARRSYPPLH